jgi:hypothetical protein
MRGTTASVPEWAGALAGGLGHVPQLTTLDVLNNSIGVDGARALASGLARVPQLTTLSARGNFIGAERADALRESAPRGCNVID